MCRWRNSETFRVKGGEDPTPCPHQAGTSGGRQREQGAKTTHGHPRRPAGAERAVRRPGPPILTSISSNGIPGKNNLAGSLSTDEGYRAPLRVISNTS